MSKNIIIFDLDGTIADISHRMKYIQKKPKDWKTFFEYMHEDNVYDWAKDLILSLHNTNHRLYFVSGRPEQYRRVIDKWLEQNNIKCYSKLLLRKNNDFRADNIIKQEILNNEIEKDEILFVVDDRQRVVDMWRENGLVCLQCYPNDI